ncbi:MAG: isoprenylcysteine carboxylmethyltransferase family protein [Candidatus Aminicenantes bacterium]|nr:isoprenylcysteine carboxylmethyltransferase family protein [Candidatus Aminicenantes bacterium]
MNEETKQTSEESVDLKALKKTLLVRYFLIFPGLGLMFCLPAWTIKYWEAWAYIFILATPMALFGLYMFKHDPKMLERRMRTKEKRKEQKMIVKLSLLPYLAAFILPGFDKRLGWSNVPLAVKIIALALVLAGYLMVLYVFITNSYASRIVEVEKDQKVITTGPYTLVRHPMYLATFVLYIFSPLALGSYWAMIPTVFFLFIFIPRIKDEEKELFEKLEGYKEYTLKTKYRLIPGIW